MLRAYGIPVCLSLEAGKERLAFLTRTASRGSVWLDLAHESRRGDRMPFAQNRRHTGSVVLCEYPSHCAAPNKNALAITLRCRERR